MQNKKKRILIISSADPLKGPGLLALDMYKSLLQAGADVDLLTKNPVDGHPEVLYVEEKSSVLEKIRIKIRSRFLKQEKGYFFFYKKETNPPISTEKVLAKITKPYDMVCVLFWQDMLSFKTINDIYEKLKCRIVFRCVDYSPMSGGCHFTGSCERYQIGCGACPAIGSTDENDFTAWNVKYRKQVYDHVKPIVFGNSYMQKFYNKSFLLKDVRKVLSWPIIDVDSFKPLDASSLRKKYGIADHTRFIIFFGCQSLTDPRKGMNLLVESLKIFADQLTEEQRNGVLLMAAGRDFSALAPLLPFESRDFGYVNSSVLPDLYSMADVFVCPSVNDAGPMMVNQSLCCGTPVVGFEMGACLQAVKDHGTGYCAQLNDVVDLASGIRWVYGLSQSERRELSAHCREFAVLHHSYRAFSDQLLSFVDD